jgi:hypothetical protein
MVLDEATMLEQLNPMCGEESDVLGERRALED